MIPTRRRPGPLLRPLGRDLPDEFGTLRRLMESRMGRRGKREFVQVLRLLEIFSMGEVHPPSKMPSDWEPSALTR